MTITSKSIYPFDKSSGWSWCHAGPESKQDGAPVLSFFLSFVTHSLHGLDPPQPFNILCPPHISYYFMSFPASFLLYFKFFWMLTTLPSMHDIS